jgi:hypothetical protein
LYSFTNPKNKKNKKTIVNFQKYSSIVHFSFSTSGMTTFDIIGSLI